jgi:hypothetical protein
MIIITIGPGLSDAGILADLAVQDSVVAALLPGHKLSRQAVKDLLGHSYVFEYLQQPQGVTSILCDVFARLNHLVTGSRKPLVFVNRPMSVTDIRTHADNANVDSIDILQGRGGTPDQISIGAKLLPNPLLPRFFALVSELGIGDQRGMDLLQQTFGGTRA